MVGSSVTPCVFISDLDFGTFSWPADSGVVRTLPLDICNEGDTPLLLPDSTPSQILPWNDSSFSISGAWLDSLRGRTLEPGTCLSIPVAFRTTRPGYHVTIARLLSDTDCRRDTSQWSAVVAAASRVTSADADEYWLGTVHLANSSGLLSVPFSVGRAGHVVIELIDMAGRRRATVFDDVVAEGRHGAQCDIRRVSSGAYILLISSGEWEAAKAVVVTR